LSTSSENVWSTVAVARAFSGESVTVDRTSVIGGALEKAAPFANATAMVSDGFDDVTEPLMLAALLPLTMRNAMLFKGVGPDSKVETFAAVRLEIQSWRWSGVPFLIRAGKCLPVTTTEVLVKLRKPPLDN
jgi:Glucose-6-phosphate dehydrogenase, C-terminal domain